MDVTSKQLRRCDLVTAKGRIDAATTKTLADMFAAILKAGRYRIVLNLREVTYISSAGLGELVHVQKQCKQLNRGELVLAETPQRVHEILELAGLKPLFKSFETETEAVGSF